MQKQLSPLWAILGGEKYFFRKIQLCRFLVFTAKCSICVTDVHMYRRTGEWMEGWRNGFDFIGPFSAERGVQKKN